MKLLLLVLILTACAHRTSLKSVDKTLDSMVQTQLNSLPDDLWPGFKQYKPLVLYNTIDGQYLIGAKNYPVMGYKKYNKIQKHPLGEKFEPSVYHIAFPKEWMEPFFPKLTRSVFMIDSLERMKSLGRKWNQYDWATIYIHEIFHLFQGTKTAKSLIKRESIDSEILATLKNDKKNVKLLITEQRIIRTALLKLDFNNSKKVFETCNSLIEQRNIRYTYIDKKYSKAVKGEKPFKPVMNEQFYETIEGTARYIEKHIDLSLYKDIKIKKFINKDLLVYLEKYDIKTYYYMLHQIELGENYYYETGFGLSLFLDKLNPNWKKEAFKTTLWDQVLESCKR
jgi:hypothetical protein